MADRNKNGIDDSKEDLNGNGIVDGKENTGQIQYPTFDPTTGVDGTKVRVLPWMQPLLDGKEYGSVTDLSNRLVDFVSGNATQRALVKRIAKTLTGNANANFDDVEIAFANLLSRAAQNGSIKRVLDTPALRKGLLNGTSFQKETPTSYRNTVISLSTQDEAFTAVNDAIGQWLGRTATAAEKKDFYKKLIAAQKKAPSKVTGISGSNARQTTIGGGVNPEKFAQQYVLGKIDVAKPDLAGQLGDAQDIILSTATKNGIEMSQAQSIALVKRFAKGEALDTIKNELSLKAQSKYTALADQLKANPGATVYDLSSEYINEMANILEIPAAQLKITDVEPAIAAIDKDGKQRTLATWEWRKQLRNDPRFQYTTRAKNEATDMARSFARSFGVNV